MNIDALMAPARSGLEAEQLRMSRANTRIALANTPIGSVNKSQFAELAGMSGDDATRKVFEPNHPEADSAGFIHYPEVNLVDEMLTLMTSSRAYEANVKSFNTMRSMIAKALDIGANR